MQQNRLFRARPETTIEGARGTLNITGGPNLGLYEVNEAAELVAQAADPEANIIFGVIDETWMMKSDYSNLRFHKAMEKQERKLVKDWKTCGLQLQDDLMIWKFHIPEECLR